MTAPSKPRASWSQRTVHPATSLPRTNSWAAVPQVTVRLQRATRCRGLRGCCAAYSSRVRRATRWALPALSRRNEGGHTTFSVEHPHACLGASIPLNDRLTRIRRRTELRPRARFSNSLEVCSATIFPDELIVSGDRRHEGQQPGVGSRESGAQVCGRHDDVGRCDRRVSGPRRAP
jgi:hypothetical protein